MDKFTNLTKQDIKSKAISNDDKTEVEEIIESCLNIKVDGDIDKFLSKNIEIEGKDKLIESLTNYIERIKDENTESVLEKVKYQGYSFVENELFEKQTAGQLKKHKERIRGLLKKDDFETHTQRQADRIKSGEKAFYRAMAAEQMIARRPKNKKELTKIHDIFLFRSKQLGYKK